MGTTDAPPKLRADDVEVIRDVAVTWTTIAALSPLWCGHNPVAALG